MELEIGYFGLNLLILLMSIQKIVMKILHLVIFVLHFMTIQIIELSLLKEFKEALQIFRQDKKIGHLLDNQQIQIYPPMPPLLNNELSDGSIQRTINIGLIASNKGINRDSNNENREFVHEIVGINMI